MTFPLETERLLLRPQTLDDLDAMLAVLGDPRVAEWLSGAPLTRAEVRARIDEKMEIHQSHGYSMWAVIERGTGTVIGDTGLQPLDGGSEIEIGWRFRADRWGRGYATEAARAALAFGFEEAGLDEIAAVTLPENLRSRRVMEQIGMEYDGSAWYYGHQQVKYVIRRVAA
jgi:ribosomal-protein-alanine N-acetyltransferase